MLRAEPAPRVLTVTQLAALVRETLEGGVGRVWVAGEISNLRPAPSGHVYFTLKDEQSQLGAVLFRSAAQVLAFRPADGMEVLVSARVGLYPPRGALQLYVDTMEPRGLGALQLAFEQLKARLGAEGLFAAGRKRPLPRFPRAVGIVTALGGAVIHDMRTVLRRRWPACRIVVRPVRVQGAGAGREVAAGIEDLNRLGGLDVLIVGRGGGALEDLWAFNEEIAARAIAASAIPVVSAVGHEVDFTIADFVADARAPTPTAAASLVVPDREGGAAGLARAEAALRRARRAGAARARDGRAGRRTARRPLATRLPGARLRHRAPRRLDRPRGARRGRARRGRRRRSRVRARAGPRAHRGDRAREGAVMAEPPATPRFEDALAELEGLVQRLEKGELPLEESLAAFERGIALVRSLGQRLAEVEQRVEVLLKSEAGKLVLRPFENDEE